MCGLAGFFGAVGQAPELELSRMGDAIEHRGPDSNGVWIDQDAGIGLVHQRLSIVDLSAAGHQPMVSSNGRFVLAFNGEIYNHIKLRAELDRSGIDPAWRGSSDTETVLACIQHYGLENAVGRWVGMFAFALWDRKEGTLSLGRDRFGEKPMYYGINPNTASEQRLLFGSELRAILASDEFQPIIDKEALTLYFRHHYVPAPHSILQGIRKLTAGTIAVFNKSNQAPSIKRYWFAPEVAQEKAKSPFSGSLKEATDRVEDLLEQAIAGQSMADVPVGAFLSGGIDSSTVVALMKRVNTESSVKTFSVGFSEAGFNEAVYAKKVADHLKTDHTEYYLSGAEARDLIPNIATLGDEPFADASQLPTFVVSRLAREQVTVSLSGDGGDELFGGYTRYAQAARVMGLRKKLGKVGRGVAKGLATSPLFSKTLAGQLQLAHFPQSIKRRGHRFSRAIELLAQPHDSAAYLDMVSFWKPPCSVVASDVNPASNLLDPAQWLADGTPQEAVQMLDVLNYLPDDILTKVDRCGMQVSLESRIPMLDHRLAEFVWSLPASLRANPKVPKQILFDIACRHVPRELIDRPKSGFGIPIADWLRGALQDWAEDLLDEDTIRQQGLLDVERIKGVWQQFLNGDDYMGDLIWSVLMFQAWYINIMGK